MKLTSTQARCRLTQLRVLISLTLFLKPKYAPTNVSGTDTPNHSANNANNVLNGTAPELPLLQSTKFITKNNPKTTLKCETVAVIWRCQRIFFCQLTQDWALMSTERCSSTWCHRNFCICERIHSQPAFRVAHTIPLHRSSERHGLLAIRSRGKRTLTLPMTWTAPEHRIPATPTTTFLCVAAGKRHRAPISIRIPLVHLHRIPFDCNAQCLCAVCVALSLQPCRTGTVRWPANLKCWTTGCSCVASTRVCSPIAMTILSCCSVWTWRNRCT